MPLLLLGSRAKRIDVFRSDLQSSTLLLDRKRWIKINKEVPKRHEASFNGLRIGRVPEQRQDLCGDKCAEIRDRLQVGTSITTRELNGSSDSVQPLLKRRVRTRFSGNRHTVKIVAQPL